MVSGAFGRTAKRLGSLLALAADQLPLRSVRGQLNELPNKCLRIGDLDEAAHLQEIVRDPAKILHRGANDDRPTE